MFLNNVSECMFKMSKGSSNSSESYLNSANMICCMLLYDFIESKNDNSLFKDFFLISKITQYPKTISSKLGMLVDHGCTIRKMHRTHSFYIFVSISLYIYYGGTLRNSYIHKIACLSMNNKK